jgi:transposase
MILNLNSFTKIYIYKSFVDMRKQINGLAVVVEHEMQLNPFEKYLFVFIGKKKNSIKLLYWDRSGFCLWQKKLEKEKFICSIKDKSIFELSEQQLLFLLDGYDIWRMKPHSTLSYKYVS